MKQYIRDYENYILRMGPGDLALYLGTKCESWQSHQKSTLDKILENASFLPMGEDLVREVCPDSEDSRDAPPIVSLERTDDIIQTPGDVKIVPDKSVFCNEDFLKELEDFIDGRE